MILSILHYHRDYHAPLFRFTFQLDPSRRSSRTQRSGTFGTLVEIGASFEGKMPEKPGPRHSLRASIGT